MTKQDGGGIFIISEKFEEIQSEIYQNHLTDSPITIANTNLAPQVSTCTGITRDPFTRTKRTSLGSRPNNCKKRCKIQISTRTDEIIYKMISPERSDSTAVFIPDNKAHFQSIILT